MKILISIVTVIYSIGLNAQIIRYVQTGEEFSGPLSSWKNVKTDFGAKGDGFSNDAPAINAAMSAMRVSASDSFNVLYFPAGTYLINDSLYNPGNGYDGMTIIGEDPANTIISWNGPAGGSMFYLTGWYLRVSRLTFDGKNNAYRGLFKAGGFSTHNEFSDLVFKNFKTGVGLDLSGTSQGQAENAIMRCRFTDCSSGIASCNWNSLDQWVWYCLFEDCKMAINQCVGYFQIYNNVFLRSSVYDIGSSPYKSAIVNNTSINSKCFYAGTEAYIRGNKIYSNADSFYTVAGNNTVMLDNVIRTTHNAMATTRVGNANLFVGNTFSKLNSKWSQWAFQPPFKERSHGIGSGNVVNKPIEKGIDGDPVTSYAVDAPPFGIKWNCPMGTQRSAVKYSISANANANSPKHFQLLGSNDWGSHWDVLDFRTNQKFTGGANPVSYRLSNTTPYSMYELLAINPWQNTTSGGRAISNMGAQSGSYCEKMTLSPFPRNVYQNIAVNGDSSYLAEGWMSSDAVTTNGIILVFWYSKRFAPPFGIYPIDILSVDTLGLMSGTNGWTNYKKIMKAPSNSKSALFYLGSLSNAVSSGTVWFDHLSFATVADPGNNLLLDPDFEDGQNQSVFELNEFTLLDTFGNDITKDKSGFVSGANEPWGNFYSFDNNVVDTAAIPVPSIINLPGTPQNVKRIIFDVVKGTGNDALEIQSKINAAAQLSPGSKPIVHIPIGQFNINTTLTVPSNSDMQIIGDGLGTGVTTRLNWSGNKAGPLMLLKGPSRVTIKDLLLNVPYDRYIGPEALVIENADQSGGRIFGNQFSAGGPQWTQPCDIGMFVDGIENTDVTMINFYPGSGNAAMVKAKGGKVLSAGGITDGQISLLAGATGNAQNLFSVSNGGRIDAEGMWNEGDWARTSGLLNLSNNSGQVSVACMSWIIQTPIPMIEANDFKGSLTLLLNHFKQAPLTAIPLSGDGSKMNLFSAYNDFGAGNKIGNTSDSTWLDTTSPDANSDFISNTSPNGLYLDDVINKVHNGRADTASILNSLAQLRAVRTDPPNDRIPGVTDVKLFRVAAWGTKGHVAAHFYDSNVSTATQHPVSVSADDFIKVYPSLVSHEYKVRFDSPQTGTISIALFDVFGKRIFRQEVKNAEALNEMHFNAETLMNGTYFLQVQSGGRLSSCRFMVQRD